MVDILADKLIALSFEEVLQLPPLVFFGLLPIGLRDS